MKVGSCYEFRTRTRNFGHFRRAVFADLALERGGSNRESLERPVCRRIFPVTKTEQDRALKQA
jgi:hypothetical protein